MNVCIRERLLRVVIYMCTENIRPNDTVVYEISSCVCESGSYSSSHSQAFWETFVTDMKCGHNYMQPGICRHGQVCFLTPNQTITLRSQVAVHVCVPYSRSGSLGTGGGCKFIILIWLGFYQNIWPNSPTYLVHFCHTEADTASCCSSLLSEHPHELVCVVIQLGQECWQQRHGSDTGELSIHLKHIVITFCITIKQSMHHSQN